MKTKTIPAPGSTVVMFPNVPATVVAYSEVDGKLLVQDADGVDHWVSPRAVRVV